MSARLSGFDRGLTLWILAAMGLGVAIGAGVPGWSELLGRATVRGVNVPIAIGLMAMLLPPLAHVRYRALPGMFRSPRILAISLALNWIIGPALMFCLAAWWLPDRPDLFAGVVLIGIARCIAMVLVWNDLAGGDREFAAGLVALNSVFQIVAFPTLAWFYLTVLPRELNLASTSLEVPYRLVAEACKILENTYRAVNIALVNELKVLCDRMGLDVWQVIDAAKTKPFGFQAFYPGPGLGGHCIPIDPFYLSWVARKHGLSTRFIELAGEINTAMPRYVVDKVVEGLNDAGKPVRGSRICLLGVAYKRDVDDPRESPAFELLELLAERGAVLSYSDPHVPVLPAMRRRPALSRASIDWESRELTADYLSAQDLVIIVTDHSAFDYDQIVRHSRLIVDTRNATARVAEGREKILKA